MKAGAASASQIQIKRQDDTTMNPGLRCSGIGGGLDPAYTVGNSGYNEVASSCKTRDACYTVGRPFGSSQ